MKIEVLAPKSFCTCTHTGDGPDSNHTGIGPAAGHGVCTACTCMKFRWAGWTMYGKDLMKKVQKARKGGHK